MTSLKSPPPNLATPLVVATGTTTEDQLIACPNGWDYDPNAKWSLISEWDLVCDNDYIGHLYLTLNSVGAIFGTLLFSVLQDTIGRKLSFFIAMPWCIFWGCISILMPSMVAYMAIGFIKALVGLALFQVRIVCTMYVQGVHVQCIGVNRMYNVQCVNVQCTACPYTNVQV